MAKLYKVSIWDLGINSSFSLRQNKIGLFILPIILAVSNLVFNKKSLIYFNGGNITSTKSPRVVKVFSIITPLKGKDISKATQAATAPPNDLPNKNT